MHKWPFSNYIPSSKMSLKKITSQLQPEKKQYLAHIVSKHLHKGKPSLANSAVFFTLFKGGGVKGRLNNVKKTALFTNEGFPNLMAKILVIKYEIHSSKDYIPQKSRILTICQCWSNVIDFRINLVIGSPGHLPELIEVSYLITCFGDLS